MYIHYQLYNNQLYFLNKHDYIYITFLNMLTYILYISQVYIYISNIYIYIL